MAINLLSVIGGTNENGDILTEQRGLIPRIFEYLFQLMKEDKNATYTCKCSFLEIYPQESYIITQTPFDSHYIQ